MSDYTYLGIFLIAGTLLMLMLSLIRRKRYALLMWRCVVITLLLTVAGVIGAFFMFFLENGYWGGQSFYGAVLFIPILFYPVARMFHISYGKLLDFIAPAELVMLAVLKINCFRAGCCAGFKLIDIPDDLTVHFPCQIVEAVVAIIIMFILLHMEKKNTYTNCLYPMFLILYGATRFFLNFLRENYTPLIWAVPAGHFWSVFSVILGIVLLVVIRKKHGLDPKVHKCDI